ncbi:MAG: DUF177 domain-containing protein [Desulfosarcinaceae bacterium]|jgi:uncharacterized protein
MKLNINDLSAGEMRLRMAVDPIQLPALEALHRGGQVGFGHPLNVDLRAFRNRDMVTVLGRLTTQVAMDCARCLTRHLQPLDFAVELSYLQGGESAAQIEAASNQDLELDAREAGLIRFEGDILDLGEGIAEQVIMRLPIKPLCDPGCKGLCSRCGANLNRERCSCARDESESPFAVLQHWLPKAKGD